MSEEQDHSVPGRLNVRVKREFPVGVEAVWRAFSDPTEVMRWWGPNFFTCPSAKLDFREGGVSIVCMRAPAEWNGGQENYNTWDYQKILPFQRLEYIQNLSDKDGNPVDPTTVGLPPDFPKDVYTVVTLTPLNGQTEMIITEYGFLPGQLHEFAQIGLEQCMDKMGATFTK